MRIEPFGPNGPDEFDGMPTDDGGFFSTAPLGFLIFGGFVVTFIAVVFVITIVGAIRNYRNLKRAGVDPLTVQSTAYLHMQRAGVMQPNKSMAERLAELDRLRADGTISAEEHTAARAKVLGGT